MLDILSSRSNLFWRLGIRTLYLTSSDGYAGGSAVLAAEARIPGYPCGSGPSSFLESVLRHGDPLGLRRCGLVTAWYSCRAIIGGLAEFRRRASLWLSLTILDRYMDIAIDLHMSDDANCTPFHCMPAIDNFNVHSPLTRP